MKILVLNSAILAVDPIDTGDAWQTADQIIPKHVAEGAALVDVDYLPADYAPGRYAFDGGFIPVPQVAPKEPVPQSVSMRQASLALYDAGLLDDVEALVATLPRPHQIEWQRASEVYRDNPLVEVVRQQKSMTVEQIDDLFRKAATL